MAICSTADARASASSILPPAQKITPITCKVSQHTTDQQPPKPFQALRRRFALLLVGHQPLEEGDLLLGVVSLLEILGNL